MFYIVSTCSFCRLMKQLLRYKESCNLGYVCQNRFCVSLLHVLQPWKRCTDMKCSICFYRKKCIKKTCRKKCIENALLISDKHGNSDVMFTFIVKELINVCVMPFSVNYMKQSTRQLKYEGEPRYWGNRVISCLYKFNNANRKGL